MEFQCDLSTYQTLLTQIIVQQSCSWTHITFWEKEQGYCENGYTAQGQLGRLAPRAPGWEWHISAPGADVFVPRLVLGAWKEPLLPAVKCWKSDSGMGEIKAERSHWEIKQKVENQ